MALLHPDEQAIAVASLRSSWADIGMPEKEAEEALATLCAELRLVVSTAVEREKRRKDELEAEEKAMRSELSSLAAALGEEAALDASAKQPPLVAWRAVSAEAERLRAKQAERLAHRRTAVEQLHAILIELNTGTPEEDKLRAVLPDASEPTAEAPGGLTIALLERLQSRLAEAETIRSARVERMDALRASLEEIIDNLGMREAEQSDTACAEYHPSVGATHRALSALEARLDHLREEKARRLHVLNQCSDYISELRFKLKIPEAEHISLPSPETGLSQQVLVAYSTELERLEAIKAERISELIPETRVRIANLAAELQMADDDLIPCARTTAMTNVLDANATTDFSGEKAATNESAEELEQLLYDLEGEERRLRDRVASTAKIFSLLAKRESILTQRDEMRASERDPNRLLAKGAGAARRLLQEEKLRTAVEKDLPRMNKKLRELVAAWEQEHGETLHIGGMTVPNVLKAQEDEDTRYREEEKQRKETERHEKLAAKEEAKAASRPGSARPPISRPGTAGMGARRSAAPERALAPSNDLNSPTKVPRTGFGSKGVAPSAAAFTTPAAKENQA